MNDLDRADYEFLLDHVRRANEAGIPLVHLDQPLALWNYIRMANDIAGQVPPCDLLDWGCGLGQMTYLLRRRGFRVTSFDLGTDDVKFPDLPLWRGLHVVRTTDPIALPFAAGSFTAVLSCGVFEHVTEGDTPGDESASLREIFRVLRPDGLFFVYQLPQRQAWQEALIRRFRLGYSHPRRFSRREIVAILSENGFVVQRVRHGNMVPKNLSGMPGWIKSGYRHATPILALCDTLCCRVPGLNRISGTLEVVARRESAADADPGRTPEARDHVPG